MTDHYLSQPTGSRELQAFAFSVAEAAQMTGLSRSTIYLAVQNGELNARKHGRRTLILAEDIRDFLAALPGYSA